MGRKGKKIICHSKSHITVMLLLSEHNKGTPSPSTICFACTFQAVAQQLCLLLPAPAAEARRQR